MKTNSLLYLNDTTQTFIFVNFQILADRTTIKVWIFDAHNEAKCTIIPKRHNTNLDI